METLFTSIKDLLARPFNSQQSLIAWVFVAGLFIIFVIIWVRILSHILEGVGKEL